MDRLHKDPVSFTGFPSILHCAYITNSCISYTPAYPWILPRNKNSFVEFEWVTNCVIFGNDFTYLFNIFANSCICTQHIWFSIYRMSRQMQYSRKVDAKQQTITKYRWPLSSEFTKNTFATNECISATEKCLKQIIVRQSVARDLDWISVLTGWVRI